MNDLVKADSTEVGDLVKDSFNSYIKSENLVPLVVGNVIVALGSALTLGILGAPLFYGYVDLTMRIARGERVSLDVIWGGFSKFGVAFVTGLLFLIACIVGLIGLIVGSVVVAFLLAFSFHELVAKPGIGAIDALKGSFELVKNHVSEVIVTFIVGIVVVAVTGAIIPVIGGLISGPFMALVWSLLYVRLTRQKGQTSAL